MRKDLPYHDTPTDEDLEGVGYKWNFSDDEAYFYNDDPYFEDDFFGRDVHLSLVEESRWRLELENRWQFPDDAARAIKIIALANARNPKKVTREGNVITLLGQGPGHDDENRRGRRHTRHHLGSGAGMRRKAAGILGRAPRVHP